MMKSNKWTFALAAAGVISVGSVVQAEEAKSSVITALSSTTLSGYVDTSAIWNFASTGNATPGRSFDGAGKQDGFNLNVVKLSLAKPLDAGQWSAGYNVDLLFGPDANTYNTASAGPNTSDSGVKNSSDFAIKNANISLRVPVGNGLDLKVGFWDTIIGYEVFEAGSNPNYSRSYGYLIEPTQHTGILASYRVSDALSFSAGIANTGGANINARSGHDSIKTYMASVTLTAPEKSGFISGATLYAGIIDGVSPAGPGPDSINYYVGAALPTPMEGLSLGAALDYRTDFSFDGSEDLVLGLYVSYQAMEKLKLNFRGEFAQGQLAPVTGAKPRIWGATVTADYKLWDNVVSRVELRHDFASNKDAEHFGDGTDDSATTLSLNLIYKF